ncbi:MAG: hypothetical protein HY907_11540 [Deltaproteobacteria bacterium]|nr:hypothetical protein [Deltaproteobacteria bacterium]
MPKVLVLGVLAAGLWACKGSDGTAKIVKTTFNPQLGAVPGDLPDKPPPEKLGDQWTIYGLWVVTQSPDRQAEIKDAEITVKGHVVNVTKPASDEFGQSMTPHVWIADQASRKGLFFPLTGYADNYVALEEAAAYDRCIESCTKSKGDPRAEADRTPGRYSRIFGDCVVDVPECRALYEENPSANFFKLMGPVLKWYVRDQVFGSPKRVAIEEELRGQGNIVCEAGPAQRRLLLTAIAAVTLGLDLEQFKKDVEQEIEDKYPHQRVDDLDPEIVKDITNAHLKIFDDPQNVKKAIDLVRALRAGTDTGEALLGDRKIGPELKAAISKGEGSDIKKVADEMLMDLLIRWFWSKADAKKDANMACVFDDLINFTSSYNLAPMDLLTRRRAMLGPAAGVTWEQAMESQQAYEFRIKFVSQSRTGFLGWTMDLTPSMVCEIKENCPDYLNPVFGTVYDFGFAEAEGSTP